MPSAFDKDFGYLMPFLDKIGAAASALEDPRARTEAMSLVAGERERWNRIRALLGGAVGKAATTKAAPLPAVAVRAQAEVAARHQPTGSIGSGLTVGPLKNAR